jgi:hypothetical protein
MRAIVVGLLVALAAPATASAQGVPLAPAGNSAVGQYLEIVPTASGGRPSNSFHAGGGVGAASGAGGGGSGTPLTPATQRALADQGRIGVQAAAIAQATAPAGLGAVSEGVHTMPVARREHRRAARHMKSRATATKTASGHPSAPVSQPPVPQRSAASQVVQALTGSAAHGGLGPLMPVLLVATVAGALVAVIRRRRHQ